MEFLNLFYFYSKYISRVRTDVHKKENKKHKTYLLNLYEKNKRGWINFLVDLKFVIIVI